jgi:hypothetical protein
MMSDEYLTEVLCRELEQTHDVQAAVRAVRLAIVAHRDEQRDRRRHFGDSGRRGPEVTCKLGPNDLVVIIQQVAYAQRLSVDDVRDGTSRVCLHARWVVASVLRCYGCSLKTTAAALGMTDHTRVIDGTRRLAGYPNLVECRDSVIESLVARGWQRPAATPLRSVEAA